MTQAIQLAAGAYLSGRNRLINGAMLSNSRASSIASVAGQNVRGAAEGWLVGIAGTTTAAMTQANTSGVDSNGINKLWLRQTVTTAEAAFPSAQYVGGISQCIEGVNCYDLKTSSLPIAVSFMFQATLSGQYSVALVDSAFAYSCIQTFNYIAGGAPQYVTLLFPSAPIGVSFVANTTTFMLLRIGSLANGTLQAATNGTWQNVNAYSAAGNVNWCATIGNYIQATDVQLEAGLWSPFEKLLHQQNVANCQRYYEAGTQTLIGYASTGATQGVSVPFRVLKRGTPVMTNAVSVNTNCSSTLSNFPTPDNNTATTVVTALGTFQLNQAWTASAELL